MIGKWPWFVVVAGTPVSNGLSDMCEEVIRLVQLCHLFTVKTSDMMTVASLEKL